MARIIHLTTTDDSLEFLLGPQLEAMVAAGHDVIGVSAPGKYVERLAARGVAHEPLHASTRAMSLASDLRAMRELNAIVRRVRPDVLHCHNPKPGLYGRLIGRAAGVPVVVNTVHGLYASPDDHWLKRAVVYSAERLAAACSDAELVQNPEDLALLKRLRVPSSRLHLLGNGIDLTRFNDGASLDGRAAQRAALGVQADTVLIGTVGRLVLEKGYAELFTAAAGLVERFGKRVAFVVVGPEEPHKSDAVDRETLERARASGILFLGHRSDVELFYPAFDVFVLASHREGFPRSAMEAAACGCPLVLTDIRGCRQVLEHERQGLLVPRSDPAALQHALGRLIDEPALRLRYGAAAAERARRDFDQQAQIRLSLELYERLLVRRVR